MILSFLCLSNRLGRRSLLMPANNPQNQISSAVNTQLQQDMHVFADEEGYL